MKPIDQMSEEELLERLRSIRNNRSVVRPAHKAHVERAEKKETRKRVKKTTDLLSGLSDADRLALIKQLEEGE